MSNGVEFPNSATTYSQWKDYIASYPTTSLDEEFWPVQGSYTQATIPQALVDHLIEQTAQRVVEILAARRIGVEP